MKKELDEILSAEENARESLKQARGKSLQQARELNEMRQREKKRVKELEIKVLAQARKEGEQEGKALYNKILNEIKQEEITAESLTEEQLLQFCREVEKVVLS